MAELLVIYDYEQNKYTYVECEPEAELEDWVENFISEKFPDMDCAEYYEYPENPNISQGYFIWEKDPNVYICLKKRKIGLFRKNSNIEKLYRIAVAYMHMS